MTKVIQVKRVYRHKVKGKEAENMVDTYDIPWKSRKEVNGIKLPNGDVLVIRVTDAKK